MSRFGRKKKPLLFGTVLGPETVLEGTLEFSDSLCIRGRFAGRIIATGFLRVERDAECAGGPFQVASASIAGGLSGNIEAESSVELARTATVKGDITANSVRIEDGARCEGELIMSSR
ncbi:MAG: polymer-forming cytoskeletal protein [Rectinema sp.]